jgi:hypothetical protein
MAFINFYRRPYYTKRISANNGIGRGLFQGICKNIWLGVYNTGWSNVSVHLTITIEYITHTIDELKMAITQYIRNVDRAVLNTVFDNTVLRVNKCVETGGGHFEHYL